MELGTYSQWAGGKPAFQMSRYLVHLRLPAGGKTTWGLSFGGEIRLQDLREHPRKKLLRQLRWLHLLLVRTKSLASWHEITVASCPLAVAQIWPSKSPSEDEAILALGSRIKGPEVSPKLLSKHSWVLSAVSLSPCSLSLGLRPQLLPLLHEFTGANGAFSKADRSSEKRLVEHQGHGLLNHPIKAFHLEKHFSHLGLHALSRCQASFSFLSHDGLFCNPRMSRERMDQSSGSVTSSCFSQYWGPSKH